MNQNPETNLETKEATLDNLLEYQIGLTRLIILLAETHPDREGLLDQIKTDMAYPNATPWMIVPHQAVVDVLEE